MWSQLLCLSLSDMRAAPMVNLCRPPRNWPPDIDISTPRRAVPNFNAQSSAPHINRREVNR